MSAPFGRAMRHLWDLEEGGAFLNHGSFGACPKGVLAEQARFRAAMESQPDVHFRRDIMPRDGEPGLLRRAAARVAAFVNATGGAVAFVENATTGVQAALWSVPLAPGDEILITSHTYNAVRLMVEARCRGTGAAPAVVRIPVPASTDEILARFEQALSPRVRLAIVDHITSPTALVMPLERIVALLRERGVRVLVDGAHAAGQVPLDLAALAPDWYASNAHKWLFAPKGCAFLYASRQAAGITQPNVVSHFVERGFPESFDWVGTRDYSAWLAAPAAIDFHGSLDPEAVRVHRRRLLELFSERLAALGARAVGSMEMCAAMRSFVLPQKRPATPQDALDTMRTLWERDRVQAMAVKLGDELLVRMSAQVYVDEDDVRRLCDALERDGWPGR